MSITDNDVIVYDNTFTFENSVKVNKLALYLNENKQKIHGHFRRINRTDDYNNIFECLIDDYLTKIGDTSKMVEYWYRAIWKNINCHQDLNEYLVCEYGNVINPNNGHILYLSETTNQAGTIIFNNDMTALTIIYPKIGRIVRFNGKCQHAVPNPFNSIFNENGDEENKYRHVLLFNTWNNYIPGPTEKNNKCDIETTVNFNPKHMWKKLELFDSVPLGISNINFEMTYMGNSQRRFGFNKNGKFIGNYRIKEDGYHQRMISYEIEMDEESHYNKIDNQHNE